ncbi:MAG: hypothetical protein ACXVXP_09465 [Mycobacteriaceae bacterium]
MTTLDIGLAARVIAGIRTSTPGAAPWDAPGIAAALREVGGTPGAAFAAAALAAEDAALVKPSASAFRVHWPQNAGVSAPRQSMNVRCVEHPLSFHPCPQCAAKKCPPDEDYLKAKAALAARRPIPTVQKRLADFAAAKEATP